MNSANAAGAPNATIMGSSLESFVSNLAPSTNERASVALSPEARAISALWTPQIRSELAVKAREFLERGETELHLSLDPPEMGKLHIKLEISEGSVKAVITATSREAAAFLEAGRGELLRAFESEGMNQVHVEVGEEKTWSSPDDADEPLAGEKPWSAPGKQRKASSRLIDLVV
jgi:flagellar hook-length control protein FliK